MAVGLRDYDRKRRFDATPEPRGDAGTGAAHRPMFVVQLHQARSRHYDFRLEVDGVLKSWAVPKGPSLRPGEKRLAVEVEDHPLAYAAFSGEIPAGNYGAGHVQLFDRGHWACDGDPLEAIAAGRLDFTLSGRRLEGGWRLVRTRGGGAQPQWLLVKRDDAFAADLESDDLLVTGKHRPRRADAAWRRRALALDGARAGMPAGFEPQLCGQRASPPPGDGWLHEIKWDGYRLMVDMVDGLAKLRSRGGLDWNSTFPEVARAVETLPVSGACLDGELVVLDADGRSDFAELQRVVEGRSRSPLRYLVFDLPGVAGVDLRAVPLEQRKALLRALLADPPALLACSGHVTGHGREVYAQAGRDGIEGVVSKRAGSHYRSGRGHDWLKVKHEASDEFVVVGHTEPKGSRSGFGALLLAEREGRGLRYAGRVGSGFDVEALRDIAGRLQRLRRASPTVELPPHVVLPPRGVHWVQPVLVAEVAHRGRGKEGLLRQAAFKRLRLDRQEADPGGAQPEESRGMDGASRLTSPDRVVFEGAKYTKRDVLEYYQGVADWLMPELAGRPLSVLRCPEGTARQCFFQKHHAGHLGDDVRSVELRQKSGREPYLYVDDIEGVSDLVQMNAIEFHPWGSRVDDPEHPDRLVFDLDPGEGTGWDDVVRAARDVRDRLRDAGLENFLRLSGGKGLHVVVPIARGPSWDEVRLFCSGFAEAMAAYAPERYVATTSKAKRTRRIFIDWLRNARGATSVASWSLRARRGAPVAVPLRWEELGRVDGPAAFDLDAARRRAVRLRSHPWTGFHQTRQSLPALE